MIKNDELLKKYEGICDKVKSSINDSEPVNMDKYFKTKITYYEGKVNKNFHDDKVLKEGSQYIFLLVILIDSIFWTSKNYYPQVLLEEYKCVCQRKKYA